jgi:prepilin-type N-terminal cleavage/methylation domain-containing protein
MSPRHQIRRPCAEIRVMHGRKGFTLVEVLLALAISGLLLTAATSLLITLSRAWAERPATRDAFDAHVDGVARFFISIMDKATMAPGSENAKSPIFLDRPVDFSDVEDPLISFFVREAPPVLFWPHGLAPRVHCYIYFEDGDGLSLLWYSDLQEMEMGESGKPELESEDDLFKTPISKFCQEIEYCYYDKEEEQWDLEDELQEDNENDQHNLPDFIRLVFRMRSQDLERTITIPIARISPNGLSPEKR